MPLWWLPFRSGVFLGPGIWIAAWEFIWVLFSGMKPGPVYRVLNICRSHVRVTFLQDFNQRTSAFSHYSEHSLSTCCPPSSCVLISVEHLEPSLTLLTDPYSNSMTVINPRAQIGKHGSTEESRNWPTVPQSVLGVAVV